MEIFFWSHFVLAQKTLLSFVVADTAVAVERGAVVEDTGAQATWVGTLKFRVLQHALLLSLGSGGEHI